MALWLHQCASSNQKLPEPSSSKQVKAFLMTSSGSVPLSRSPNMVRNMVKLMGPGASLIMPSRYSSEGFFPNKTGGQNESVQQGKNFGLAIVCHRLSILLF